MKKIILIIVLSIISYQLQSQKKSDLEDLPEKKAKPILNNKENIRKEFNRRQKELTIYESKLLKEKRKKYTIIEILNFEVPMDKNNLVEERDIIEDLKKNKFNFSVFNIGDITIGKTHSVVSVEIRKEKFPKGFGIGEVKIYIVVVDNIKHCPIEGELTLSYVLDKHSNTWLLLSDNYGYHNFSKANCN